MELILELLLEIVLEGSSAVLEEENRKKYPIVLKVLCTMALVAFALLFLCIAIGMSMVAIKMIQEKEIGMSILFLLVALLMIVYTINFIKKIRDTYRKNKQKDEDDL